MVLERFGHDQTFGFGEHRTRQIFIYTYESFIPSNSSMIIAASTWSKSLDSKQIEIIKIICSNLLQGWSPALKIMFPLQNAEYCSFNCL